jgi:deoxyribose-phosphate aldolase
MCQNSAHYLKLWCEAFVKQNKKLPGNPKSKREQTPSLAQFIEHTILKPDATLHDLKKLCEEAKFWRFKGVCVNACNIAFVAKELKDTDVILVAVVGFPLGASTAKTKAFEARGAISAGAREIDMVMNLGALKSQDYRTLIEDIEQVVDASKPFFVKVILETASLNDEEKTIASALAKGAGAAFVKTSTGFGAGGATVKDVALMRRIVGNDMGVKASGGIKTLNDARSMIAAGANRLGCSNSVAIMQEWEKS